MSASENPLNVTPLREADPKQRGFRAPPHNFEAEMALLGALLSNNRAYDRVSEFLRAEHFADARHGRIYAAVARLIEHGQIADPVTLKNFFEQDGALDDIGGAQYLARLAASVVTIINTEDYGRTIYDRFLRRELINLGEDVVNEAYKVELDKNALSQIEIAEEHLYKLATEGKVEGGFKSFDLALREALHVAEAAYKREGHIAGVATGLTDLDKLLGGLHPSDLVILAGRPSMGKAQPLDARVRTVGGWKAMGDLKLGDELASVDGRPSRVTGLYPQGRRTIYRLTFSDGRSTEACADHLWRVHYREWEAPRVLSTSALIEMLKRKRYQRRLWVDHCTGHFGHSDALPVDAWVLGALLGDGNLKGGSARFSTASPEMLTALAARLGDQFVLRAAGGYDWRIVQSADHRRVGRQGVWPNPLKEALIRLDLWECGSESKFVPELYLNANRQVRLELLRGLLDTDGWVEKWGSIRFSSVSEQLARGVVELARSLGGWATLACKSTRYTYKGAKKDGRRSWVVNIYHPQPGELFSVPEKLARLGKTPERRRMQVICDISVSREAEAQCIAVSHPDRLYITDDYVVTHNTALATNIAFTAARAEARPRAGDKNPDKRNIVAFFSLEMSAEELATRLLAQEARVSGHKIRRGEISQKDFSAFAQATQLLSRVPLFIDDTPALSVSVLRTRARRLKRQQGSLALIVVDYLQLLRPSHDSRPENRVQEISDITRMLKALAKELGVPVLALSQLSRQVEQREDKRPQLSDLRESGSIEQDADVVMFVYREEYYLERQQPPEGTDKHIKWQEDMARVHNVAEVIIGKQRHGPVGLARLYFDAAHTRFGNLDTDHAPDGHG